MDFSDFQSKFTQNNILSVNVCDEYGNQVDAGNACHDDEEDLVDFDEVNDLVASGLTVVGKRDIEIGRQTAFRSIPLVNVPQELRLTVGCWKPRLNEGNGEDESGESQEEVVNEVQPPLQPLGHLSATCTEIFLRKFNDRKDVVVILLNDKGL